MIAKHLLYFPICKTRGEKVKQYLPELERTQWYSTPELKEYQWKKLMIAIDHAYQNVPYYRYKFDEIGLSPSDITSYDNLLGIPVLTKEDIRSRSGELRNENLRGRLSKRRTSGSMGEPLTFFKGRIATGFMDAVMYRDYRWYKVDIGHRQARCWGMPIDKRGYLRERIKDAVMNRVRLSAFDLNEQSFHAYLNRLRSFNPGYLYGYAQTVFRLAQFVDENRIDLSHLDLQVVITTGEMLYDHQRDLIQSVFQCKVADEYGSTETGIIAMQCPEGGMHIMADNILVEFVRQGEHVRAGEVGEIVVTELNSFSVPLIRYQIGDLGRFAEGTCSCGRGLPLMEGIEGRADDFIVCPDGKMVDASILAYIVKKLPKDAVTQFRIIQKSVDELLVQLVVTNGLKQQIGKYIKHKLQGSLGKDMKISFEYVDQIPVEKSGKLRCFISEICANQKPSGE